VLPTTEKRKGPSVVKFMMTRQDADAPSSHQPTAETHQTAADDFQDHETAHSHDFVSLMVTLTFIDR
jgi:hypothetical protein